MSYLFVLGLIDDDVGAGEEELGGAVVEEGEDGLLCLLSQVIVVRCGQRLHDHLLHSVHDLYKYTLTANSY